MVTLKTIQSYFKTCNSSEDQVVITTYAGQNEHYEQGLQGLEESLKDKRIINPAIQGLRYTVLNGLCIQGYFPKEGKTTVIRDKCIMQRNLSKPSPQYAEVYNLSDYSYIFRMFKRFLQYENDNPRVSWASRSVSASSAQKSQLVQGFPPMF